MKTLKKLSQSDQLFENFIGIQLSTTAMIMKLAVTKEFEINQLGITFDEWLNLLPIIRQNGISQKELAKSLGKDKTTISRQVDTLIKNGIIKRKRSPTDQRSVELNLTEKGLALHKDSLPVIQHCDNEFQKKLTKKEQEVLIRLLKKLRNGPIV